MLENIGTVSGLIWQVRGRCGVAAVAARRLVPAPGLEPARDALALWAERSGRRRAVEPARGGLRFAFYGRVSTEEYQDPISSRARQLGQAAALVAGSGRIVAEFFDAGQSRVLPWARRPQAAALVAAMADPDRGFDAIVIGEYERAFYGSRYALMAPLFEHYGVQLWLPEAGGPVDFSGEGHEETMLALGIQYKREITFPRPAQSSPSTPLARTGPPVTSPAIRGTRDAPPPPLA